MSTKIANAIKIFKLSCLIVGASGLFAHKNKKAAQPIKASGLMFLLRQQR
jgi:hypothetical protein